MAESARSPVAPAMFAAVDPEIAECERQLRTAQLTADLGVLDRLLSDELLFTGPDGQLATKAQDLEAHRSGLVRFRERVVGGHVSSVPPDPNGT